MMYRRLPNGNIIVPVATNDGEIFADGTTEVTPGDPDYAKWDEAATRYEQAVARAAEIKAARQDRQTAERAE